MHPARAAMDVSSDELLVLIVRDPVLRGLLIGHLSLSGEVLVTFDGALDDEVLDRIAPPPAVLITDDDAVAARFPARDGRDRWVGLIHLSDGEAAPHGERRARIDPARAGQQVIDTLAAWRVARYH